MIAERSVELLYWLELHLPFSYLKHGAAWAMLSVSLVVNGCWLANFSLSALQLLKNLEPFLQHSLSMVDTLRKEDEHAMQMVGEQIQTYK